jgi:hypothetical protein
MHFSHCPSSQGQFIRRHNHIRDAIMFQIGDAIDLRPHEGPHIEVEWEPLVLAHVSLTPDPPSSPLRADEAMEVEAVAPRFAHGDEDECIEEAERIRRTTLSFTDLRHRNIDDKAAGQCRGDLGVYLDGSRLIVDVAVADVTAPPSYRRPPPRLPPPPDDSQALAGSNAAALEAKTRPALASTVNRLELSTESGRKRQSTAPS